jgi:GNAT superfamily N-acetyltransferase
LLSARVLELDRQGGLKPRCLAACGFESHPGHLSRMSKAASADEPVALRDGSPILIRPIEPGDKGAILTAFEHLSPESRYRRFFAPLDDLSDRDLAYLTEVDHHDHEALVAHTEDGEPLGVARYVRAGDPHKAEVAVAVVDHWHGRGVATALLDRLSDRAREEGVRTFTATILSENRDAMGLMRSLGETRQVGPTSTTSDLEIELPKRGMGERLKDALRHAAAGVLAGRDPSHPRTRLQRRAGDDR